MKIQNYIKAITGIFSKDQLRSEEHTSELQSQP